MDSHDALGSGVISMAVQIDRRELMQLGAAAAAVIPASSRATKATHVASYWRGDFTISGTIWRIGIGRRNDGTFWVDIPSLWRANLIPTNAVVPSNRVVLELPSNLGH